ncbi:efflux transporter periplasmic adaptor subunit [Azoarcus sp. DD4]|uniref:efflux RND transporter periplasmic adaptor subunit n=1 Tax=Azoarcus sp. DD4 TaxID=2027405 RepID=UPI00112E61DE|nr:efflux RND transporter periplasmic adaptor subunit [Azoarcus sp. DD4]QDF98377.1 efflux transporter periplasmic adaptor subunit [Azoarcus sp. DD4]
MKPAAQLSLAALAVALALGAGYWAGSRNAGHPAAAPASDGAAPAAAGERKPLYYRNPMGLPDTSPVPKKDSMGMDYIPVYADDTPDDAGVVRVSPARVQLLGVKTALAEERVLDAGLRVVGRIELDERSVVAVAPRFEGWIERLHVSAVGDPVRRGQPLFTVYSPELQSAGEELRIAEQLQRDAAATDPAAAASAARLAQATRERLKNWEITAPAPALRAESPPEGAAAATKAPARHTFHAPADGIVLEKNAVQGARFMPGEAIYRIADLSRVWVIAEVYEQDLARVAVGQPAGVSLDAFPGRRFDARVAYVYPTLNAATRSTPVRLELDNRERLLRPGMFAHVELAAGPAAPRVTVPASAVIDDGHRQVVLIALAEGRYKPQPVKLGARGQDFVEVSEGLKAGERVVVSANFLIDSESQLKAALSNLTEATADATQPAAAQDFEATGTLDGIDLAMNSITVSHGPIPALQWPEMTMDFGIASAEVVAGVAPGTAIRFRFEQRAPGEFVVTKIEPTARAADHAGHGKP